MINQLRSTKRIQALLFSAFVLLSGAAMAKSAIDTDSNDVTLAGHDAVAYFTENKAVLGKAEFTAAHKGAIYRFSSAANRDLFQTNPEKYAPAYGGFCAYGAALGKKFSVDGKAFKIVDGRLYVNKDLSVAKIWTKDVPGNIVKADQQWETIEDVPADRL